MPVLVISSVNNTHELGLGESRLHELPDQQGMVRSRSPGGREPGLPRLANVPHETICKSRFIPERGVLNTVLLAHPCSRRVRYWGGIPTKAGQTCRQIFDAVSHRDRPAVNEDRALSGHCPCDECPHSPVSQQEGDWREAPWPIACDDRTMRDDRIKPPGDPDSVTFFARGNPDIGDNVGTVHRPKRAACLRQSLLRVRVDLGHCLEKLHHKPSPHDDLSLTQVALRDQQCPVRHPMP